MPRWLSNLSFQYKATSVALLLIAIIAVTTTGIVVYHSSIASAHGGYFAATLATAAATLVACVNALVAFLFFRRMNRRLVKLAEATEAIAHGDFSEPIVDSGADALGEVATAFDVMRRSVAERDHALRRFNDLLQEEVDMRTQQLSIARDSAEEAANVLRQTNERLRVEVSEREKSEEALRRSEERYVLASRGANDGLWDWDLNADSIFYSSRWKAILGYEENKLQPAPDEWLSRVHEADLPQLEQDIADHVEGRTPHFENEHRLRHKSGGYRWVLSRGLAVRDGKNVAYRFAGSLTDITDRRTVEDRLRHRALHDELTGLPNRALLMDRLERCLQRARREEDYVFAVFFVDLDRFKLINDSLGHAAGDQLLKEFAHRLRTSLRASDTVSRDGDSAIARLGGDEFVVLLDAVRKVTDVGKIAERLHSSLYKPFRLGDNEVFITGSIGVAICDDQYASGDDLLRDADMAMYRAKTAGRDRFEIFDKKMHTEAVDRLKTENDLRRAIDSDQLRLQYQAIVDMISGRIAGFEALIRWDHPERGPISPAQFVPLAEETGLIVPIGAWVLRQACEDLTHWRNEIPDAQDLTISVNLSKRQISEPGLVDVVRSVLDDTQLPAQCLKLEITESVIMEATDSLIPALNELRDLGCQLHMDDFGTGYSSLSCLHKFPLDVIKIDRAFIVNMADDSRYTAVVNAIVILAHSLGMQVTAEGVETNEQLAQVLALEVDYCQGYYFSRPTGRLDTIDLLKSDFPWLATIAKY